MADFADSANSADFADLTDFADSADVLMQRIFPNLMNKYSLALFQKKIYSRYSKVSDEVVFTQGFAANNLFIC